MIKRVKARNLLLCICLLLAVSLCSYLFYQGLDKGPAPEIAAAEPGEKSVRDRAPVGTPEPIVSETRKSLPEVEQRTEKSKEESKTEPSSQDKAKLLKLLDELWAGAQSGKISNANYEALLLDLEEWFTQSNLPPAEIWGMLEERWTHMAMSGQSSASFTQLKKDVESKFGFALGSKDPQESLKFIASQMEETNAVEGWIASQIYHGNDPESMLADSLIALPSDSYWRSIRMASKLDAFTALDYARDNYLGEMSLGKWNQLFDPKGGAGDAESMAWIEANKAYLDQHPSFNSTEVARSLRRYHDGGEVFYDTASVEALQAARERGDYAGVVHTLEQLKEQYGEIDAAALGRFSLEWSYRDFQQAKQWLLENESYYSDREAFASNLGSMFRHEANKNPEAALRQALAMEDERHRALTTSNVLIPQVERRGIDVKTDWVSEMPEGFTKARTIAGFVLGLSRNASEMKLEGQVKSQFLKDEFDLQLISQQVNESNLSPESKVKALELLQSY